MRMTKKWSQSIWLCALLWWSVIGTAYAYSAQTEMFEMHGGYSLAVHQIRSISSCGDLIEIEDGSLWKIRSYDAVDVCCWQEKDLIVIRPNGSWLSNYEYELLNLGTGDYVKSNLSLGSFCEGEFTHWIIAIDYWHQRIWLENGMCWEVAGIYTRFKDWVVGDTVILGVYNGWLSSSTPNILINVNMNNWQRGRVL